MSRLMEILSVDVGYGDNVVLRNINLVVDDRDFIGIIGPNGGGKTTLLKVILGLIKPFNGEIVFHKGIGNKSRHGSIGYLPQLNETDKKFPITVGEVVLSGLMPPDRFFYYYTRNDKAKVREILKMTGMGTNIDTHIGDLSGGQLQRVFLARAIVSSPSLLILDEPATYVDNRFESELYEFLSELNKKMAILLVSHNIGIISGYIKTIACVNGALHYHNSNVITSDQLKVYNCPIDIITHGKVPHRVLEDHKHH